MKTIVVLAVIGFAVAAIAAEWRIAEPGWGYEFPRDHHAHRDFKTEWWYFTGNLDGKNGERFGYELTFFRHGIRPPAAADPKLSRFVVDDLKFAHFAITDVAGRRFRFVQKTSRGAFGEAGFDREDRLAWIDDWELRMSPNGDSLDLAATTPAIAVKLHLVPAKPPAIHGLNGVSAKAAGEGHASHYYSETQVVTSGEVRFGEKAVSIAGKSWFDHEWATNQLGPGQTGWDWLSVQFDDGTELMLYHLRLTSGEIDPSSSGTWIAQDGSTSNLTSSSFTMQSKRRWKSETSGADYPVDWLIEIPERRLRINVKATVDEQELALGPLTYWEGAVEAAGDAGGQPLKGRGYLELTGYAGPMDALAR